MKLFRNFKTKRQLKEEVKYFQKKYREINRAHNINLMETKRLRIEKEKMTAIVPDEISKWGTLENQKYYAERLAAEFGIELAKKGYIKLDMVTMDYGKYGNVIGQRYYYGLGEWSDDCVIAWMPLPEPYKLEKEVE